MNKKIITGIIALFVLISGITVFSFVFANENKQSNIKNLDTEEYNERIKKLGEIYKEYKGDRVNKGDEENKVLAKYEDIEVFKNDVDYYRASYIISETPKAEDEIINEILIKKLLLNQAEKAGIFIDDKEVQENIDNLKISMQKDLEGYERFKLLITSMGLSEDEYWEKSFPVYKNAYILGQHKKELREKFISENKDLTHMEMQEKFGKEYEKYKRDLLKNEKIEYFN